MLDEHELSIELRDHHPGWRAVAPTIATDAYENEDIGVIVFRSSRDGGTCFALLEGKAALAPIAPPVPLIDPAPAPLLEVCEAWGLAIASP